MRAGTTRERAERVLARLVARGWTMAEVYEFARRATARLFERGQPGAHLWGIVRNLAADQC